MAGKRETAPVRAVAFGLLALVMGWACLATHRSGSIDLSLRANKVPAVFQLSRAVDGWQFDLVVAIFGTLALASVFAAGLAIFSMVTPEEVER